jgi:hypothetical protein
MVRNPTALGRHLRTPLLDHSRDIIQHIAVYSLPSINRESMLMLLAGRPVLPGAKICKWDLRPTRETVRILPIR